MAELSDILASGTIPVANVQELQQDGVPVLTNGIPLPKIPASQARNDSIFFNTDIDRVCWKSPGGLIFRFNMRLI